MIYDNSVNDQLLRFEPGGWEVGDEINLGGTDRLLDWFDFEYYYVGKAAGVGVGSPSIQVKLYANDGPLFNGYDTPGTVLYDSGVLTGLLTSFTERSTLIFTQADFSSPILLPETFTWAVEFSDLGANDNVGLDIYDPPVVGSSSQDYWFNGANGWELRQATVDPENNPVNFAARFYAVPDGGATFAMLGLGFVAVAAIRRRQA